MAKSSKTLAANPGEEMRKEASKWLNRIAEAAKAEQTWLDDADEAVRGYTSERNRADTTTASPNVAYDFNILFSNVETIVPAIINSPPAPDIRRRWGQDDPVARDFAEILERSMRVQVDDGRLQVEMEGMAQDGFLAGRGIIRLRFKSEFEADPKEAATEIVKDDAEERGDLDQDDGAPEDPEVAPAEETAKNERVCFEAVSWRDYRHGPAKRWGDVPWMAFAHAIPGDEYKQFADGDLVRSQFDDADKRAQGETRNEIRVWEVWDRATKKVFFIDEEKKRFVKKVDDPLGLTRFFPVHDPVQAIELTGRLMPINPFSIYKKLAEELDTTTKRIRVITKQLKIKGWYAAGEDDLNNVLNADDMQFTPLQNAELLAAKGGVEGAIAFWPVEKLIVVLRELYALRDQTKQAIYEITGISDIVRGASKSSETATAQNIKSQWGSLRIQKMQRQMERAARDLFVMMSEIIPAKFSPETLEKMTGIQLVPTEQDMTPVQPKPSPGTMQQAQASAQKAEQKRVEKLQHLMQLNAMLKNKASSYYRIDVESDSTVKADLTRQKAEATQFMGAASSYFTAVAPLVQQGALPMNIAVEIFGSFARLFNLGKTVEDALDELVEMAKSKAGEPTPHQVQAKADAEASAEKTKMEMAQKTQMHDMEMQTGTIELEGKKADAAKKVADAQKAERERDLVAAQIAATGMAEVAGPDGLPTYRHQSEIATDTILQGLNSLAQIIVAQGNQAAAQNQQVIELIAAPNELIRDPVSGAPVGSRKVLAPTIIEAQ